MHDQGNNREGRTKDVEITRIKWDGTTIALVRDTSSGGMRVNKAV